MGSSKDLVKDLIKVVIALQSHSYVNILTGRSPKLMTVDSGAYPKSQEQLCYVTNAS